MGYDLAAISNLLTQGLKAFESVADAAALEELRREYLGGKGHVKAILGGIKDVPKEQRGEYGKAANVLNAKITEAFQAAQARVGSTAAARPGIDLTKPGKRREIGHAHIITQTIEEIVEIFQRIGFSQVEGPEVEDEFHNFEALNIPEGHPARDEGDNFFLEYHEDDGTPKPVPYLLRSQTSTIQIRAIEKYGAPLRVVAPGRVYRPDTVDATHHYSFTQIEGLAIDEGLTFRDLKGALELFVREFFGPTTRYRLRPHYFPFTEVSAEVDITCEAFTNIKKDWLEILGCGMVDPRVLEAVKIDPEKYTGFAWGMGVERIVMLRHGISDIRHLLENDIRFNEQFA
ncbi:MAG: phenylalanine--tRNA ligase subunit alpha [Planctomycetes bacterium]|nr:phenylalanine--tRNA ligase subunit alpha [Planctomycetota bacterium]